MSKNRLTKTQTEFSILREPKTNKLHSSDMSESQNNLKFYEKKLDQKIFFNSIFCTPYNLSTTTFLVRPIFFGAPLSKRIVT